MFKVEPIYKVVTNENKKKSQTYKKKYKNIICLSVKKKKCKSQLNLGIYFDKSL